MNTSDYIVTGFYTPDYAPLARRFEANLDTLGIPHHLYAHDKGTWNRVILMKPTIVQQAMADHPGKTIVLMDIDCIVRGDIGAILPHVQDIGLHQRCKLVDRWRPWSGLERRQKIWPSSRLLIVRDTKAARELISRWAVFCVSENDHAKPYDDEILLGRAIATVPVPVSITTLPAIYAAHEIDEIGSQAVIVHQSAHDTVRFADRQRNWIKRVRRRFYAWLGFKRDFVGVF